MVPRRSRVRSIAITGVMPLPPTRNSIRAGGGSGSTKSPSGAASRTIGAGLEALHQVGGEQPLRHRPDRDRDVAAAAPRRAADRVGAPLEAALDLDPDADVLPGTVVPAPAPAGADHQGGGVLGLGDHLLDPAAQLAGGPERVEQPQVVVGVQRRRELRARLADAAPRDGARPCRSSEQVSTHEVNRGDRLDLTMGIQRGEVRRGVARGALPRGVRRAAQGRHRACVHRRVHRHRDHRRLPLQGLPGQAVRVRHQVPLRLRLAELLPADHRHGRVHRRQLARA